MSDAADAAVAKSPAKAAEAPQDAAAAAAAAAAASPSSSSPAAAAAGTKKQRQRDERPPTVLLEEHLKSEPTISDSKELEAKISAAQHTIKEIQANIDGLTGQIETEIDHRSQARQQAKELFDQLGQAKRVKDELAKEYQRMSSILKADREARSKQSAAVRAAESKLGKIRSQQDIDDRIVEIEERIQTESLSLSEEKQLVKEIKTLKASRVEVEAIDDMRSAIELSDNKTEIDQLRAASREKKGELDKAFEVQTDLYRLAAEKKEAADACNAKVDRLIEQRKGLRANLRKAQDEERKLTRERGRGSYLHDLWKKKKQMLEGRVQQYEEFLEREKRREERRKKAEEDAARREERRKMLEQRKERQAAQRKEQEAAYSQYKEELKAWEAEQAMRDPWEDHKRIAAQLLSYLRPFAPDDYVEPPEQEDSEKSTAPRVVHDDSHLPDAVPLKRKSAVDVLKADGGVDYSEGVVGRKTKGKRRKNRRNRQAISMLHHSPDIFNQFEFLELRDKVPLERTAVPAAMDAIKAKRKWMSEQKEGPKKSLKEVTAVQVPKIKREKPKRSVPPGRAKRSDFPTLDEAVGGQSPADDADEALHSPVDSTGDGLISAPSSSAAARAAGGRVGGPTYEAALGSSNKRAAATAAIVAAAAAVGVDEATAAAASAAAAKANGPPSGGSAAAAGESASALASPAKPAAKFTVTTLDDSLANGGGSTKQQESGAEYSSQAFWKNPVVSADELSDLDD